MQSILQLQIEQIITGNEKWVDNRNGTVIEKDHGPSMMNQHKPY